MRALIVTNMYPSPEHPALGSFVRDQVQALERRGDVELELFSFAPGGGGAYARAGAALGRRFRGRRFDVVHAHFGLTVWPALAARGALRAVTVHGTDLAHPRSRAITLAGLRTVHLPAVVSAALAAEVPAWSVRRPPAVLSCGVELRRFAPIDRGQARSALGLPADERYLLFPADPRRPEKRFDRAQAVAAGTGATLLALGATPPEEVPLWINAADAVLIPSERESYGLAALEALACGVPVACTPVGIAPEALAGVDRVLCRPYQREPWAEWVRERLQEADPRIEHRGRVELYSADRMADRVVDAWRAVAAQSGAARTSRRR